MTERCASARLQAVNKRLCRKVGAARNDDVQAVLKRKPRHEPAAEESVAAYDHYPVFVHTVSLCQSHTGFLAPKSR